MTNFKIFKYKLSLRFAQIEALSLYLEFYSAFFSSNFHFYWIRLNLQIKCVTQKERIEYSILLLNYNNSYFEYIVVKFSIFGA